MATKQVNDHVGEPVDAPVGHHPRVVKLPMHQNADVNPRYHASKEDEKNKAKQKPIAKGGAGSGRKPCVAYLLPVGDHKRVSDKPRGPGDRYEFDSMGRYGINDDLLVKNGRGNMKKGIPSVTLLKGGKGSGPRKGGGKGNPYKAQVDAMLAGHARQPAAQASTSHVHAPHGPMERTPHAVAMSQSDVDAHNKKLLSAPGAMAKHQQTAHEYSSRAHTATALAKESPSAATHRAASRAHEDAADYHTAIGGDPEKIRSHWSASAHHLNTFHDINRLTKSYKGHTMTKNVASDLFKAELGSDPNGPVTTCVHCTKPLTHSDLQKGLGAHFVVDDNDQPHDGPEGGGRVEPSRPGAGVSEHDTIAPLLKSCKGPEAGDGEEFPILKSEMAELGMEVDDINDGWYTISKSEMVRLGVGDHIGYLANRKQEIMKKGGVDDIKSKKPPMKPAPSPSAGAGGIKSKLSKGGVHGPRGEPLVVWESGTDKEVAEYIEKSGHAGGYGPGTDEAIRTRGRGDM